MLGQEDLLMFAAATAELIEQRALQKRVDHKFVLDQTRFLAFVEQLAPHYKIVLSGGRKFSDYRTTYLDTSDHHYLREHYRGRRPRYKTRLRHYLGRDLSFLEVKKKNNHERTIKCRKSIAFLQDKLGYTEKQFIDQNNPILASQLQPSLSTEFSRITLVGTTTIERITCDFNLKLGRHHFKRLMILEVKQPRTMLKTPIMQALRGRGIHSLALSKYCAAAALTLSHRKMNLYRPKIRLLRNIEND